MFDALHAILKRSEREPAVFHADQVAVWPQGELDRWVASGVLQPISPASSLPTLCCGGEQVGEVVFLTDADAGRVSAYVSCPHCGPSPLSPAALRRWRVDLERLTHVVFAEIDVAPQSVCLEAGRLWRVGKASKVAGGFVAFFGRQLHRHDAGEILNRARIPNRAVVFSPWYLPATVAGDHGPLILPLTDVVSSASNGTIRFDRDQVVDRLAEWLQTRPSAEKRAARKRASRAADIAALTRELKDHLRAARDHAVCTSDRTGRASLLPRPTQEELARRIGSSQWTVSRCLNDPEARELNYLWELAADVDRLLGSAH